MTEEEPQMSSDEAVRRGWAKLRRVKTQNRDEEDTRVWNEIGVQNHLADGVEKAMRRWAAGT